MIDDITHILKKYEPTYGALKAENLPMDALRVLLLTEGPYHPAWGAEGSRSFRYSAISLEYYWISISFLVGSYDFLFAVVYLAISVQGSIQSPVFYSFHLLDVIVSNTLKDLTGILESLTRSHECRSICNDELRLIDDDGFAGCNHVVHLFSLCLHLRI